MPSTAGQEAGAHKHFSKISTGFLHPLTAFACQYRCAQPQAKKLVLCTGAWTNELLKKMGMEELALEVRG